MKFFFILLIVAMLAFSFMSIEVLARDYPAIDFTDTGTGLVTCEGPDCNLCSLVGLVQNVINFMVYVAIFVATLMITYAGILYVTAGGSEDRLKKAHGIFWKVLIGFIIILAAWMIVDLIFKALVPIDGQPFGKPWQSIVCGATATSLSLPSRRSALPVSSSFNSDNVASDESAASRLEIHIETPIETLRSIDQGLAASLQILDKRITEGGTGTGKFERYHQEIEATEFMLVEVTSYNEESDNHLFNAGLRFEVAVDEVPATKQKELVQKHYLELCKSQFSNDFEAVERKRGITTTISCQHTNSEFGFEILDQETGEYNFHPSFPTLEECRQKEKLVSGSDQQQVVFTCEGVDLENQ